MHEKCLYLVSPPLPTTHQKNVTQHFKDASCALNFKRQCMDFKKYEPVVHRTCQTDTLLPSLPDCIDH